MLNHINKFGVKQRCMEGKCFLMDLFLTALHYDHDVNFYVYEDDFHFLGTVNRKILLKLNISTELGRKITLGEICKNVSRKLDFDIVYWQEGEELMPVLENAFQKSFPFSDELAVIEKDTERLVGIFDRKEIFHELYSVTADDETEMVCYQEKSHYYKLQIHDYNRYSKNVNSQHGEDGILGAIFDQIGTTSKFAVEFGGWDGIYLSNIRNLITARGFDGLFIEGDEERARDLVKNYEKYPNVRCVAAYVGFRGENTLDNILKANNVPEQIDLISIDIDGYDYHVWDALQNYRPRVVIIEYNPTIQNDMIVINPRNESSFCGSSAAALVELGRLKEYSLAATTESNLIFVVDEEYDKLQIWDNSLSVLRSDSRLWNGHFFQTYDKNIVIAGYTRYAWDGQKPFSKENTITFYKL